MDTRKARLQVMFVVACLVFVALVVVSVAMAQQIESSTEPEAMPAAGQLAVAYDSAISTGLPPDENPQDGSIQGTHAPQATFSYYQVADATLRGRNSTTGYAYDGNGCSHVTAGTGTGRILNTELLLPDGAVIKYLRVYYNDTNASSGVEGYITRYQPGVAAVDLVHVGSSDAFSGGYGYVVSTEITETVNNTDYAYTLIGWLDEVNVANQICGLRVAYYAPPRALYLPVITKSL